MPTNITLTLTSILTEEIRGAISAISAAGSPVGLTTIGDYTRTRGISDNDIMALMEEWGKSDKLLILEPLSEENTIGGMRSIVFKAFADMQSGDLTCLHMRERDYQVLTQQPEWPEEATEL